MALFACASPENAEQSMPCIFFSHAHGIVIVHVWRELLKAFSVDMQVWHELLKDLSIHVAGLSSTISCYRMLAT